MPAIDAEFLQHGFDPHVASRHLLVVNVVEGECLFERKKMLGPVAAGERLRNCLGAGVAAVMAQARQHLGVTLAGKNRADDPQAGRASDVGDDVVELEIHLCQRLLHMLDMRGRVLKQTLALTHVGTQLGDLAFGSKAGTQKPMRMKPLQPLRIADVGLASGHVLGIARIDKEDNKATGIEQLENWNPVNAGRFHDDGLDATFREPVHQPMQVGRERAETTDWLRRAICSYGSHVHGRPDIDGSRVRMHHRHRAVDFGLRSVAVHSPILLLTPVEGLGCAIGQIPNGIAGTASPLSSAQQPMGQVF